MIRAGQIGAPGEFGQFFPWLSCGIVSPVDLVHGSRRTVQGGPHDKLGGIDLGSASEADHIFIGIAQPAVNLSVQREMLQKLRNQVPRLPLVREAQDDPGCRRKKRGIGVPGLFMEEQHVVRPVRQRDRLLLPKHGVISSEVFKITENVIADRILRIDHIADQSLQKQRLRLGALADQYDSLRRIRKRMFLPVQSGEAFGGIEERHGLRQVFSLMVRQAENAAAGSGKRRRKSLIFRRIRPDAEHGILPAPLVPRDQFRAGKRDDLPRKILLFSGRCRKQDLRFRLLLFQIFGKLQPFLRGRGKNVPVLLPCMEEPKLRKDLSLERRDEKAQQKDQKAQT